MIGSTYSREDVLREAHIKQQLTQGLGIAVKALLQQHVNNEDPVRSDETATQVCNYLEAIFIHGLKDTFFEKVSSILTSAPNREPEPNFWPLLLIFSHKDVISQINKFSQICTDVGRCRTWIRFSLNDGLLESYVSAMVSDWSTLKYYYKSTAFVRDPEHPDIMRKYIEGLNVLTFKLACNSSSLNSWGSTPLALAGIWCPTIAPEPVITGIDIASFMENSVLPIPETTLRLGQVPGFQAEEGAHQVIIVIPPSCPAKGDSSAVSDSSSQGSCPDPQPLMPHYIEGTVPSSLPDNKLDSSVGGIYRQTLECDSEKHCLPGSVISDEPVECWAQNISTKDQLMAALCHSSHDVDSHEEVIEYSESGNSLGSKASWSSPADEFDCPNLPPSDLVISPLSSDSYKALLQNYTHLQGLGAQNLDISQTISDLSLVADTRKEQETQVSSGDSDSIEEQEFEVVTRSQIYLAEHADERTRELLKVLTTICPEVGLDSQNYQCKGCGRPIGMIYGKARVCVYDGCYYCHECHENDDAVIPARVMHNWDFSKHKVAKHTRLFLEQVEEEPLLDINDTNPQLYFVVDEMKELLTLRTQLSFLRAYLFTCRVSIADEFRKRLWPREYLFEQLHLYSLIDLIQVSSGTLAQSLKQVISFATKHVRSCRLCSQKGFICEICSIPNVIFPFELDTTYRCNRCLAVYHAACMTDTISCPKCERQMKRQSHNVYGLETTDQNPES